MMSWKEPFEDVQDRAMAKSTSKIGLEPLSISVGTYPSNGTKVDPMERVGAASHPGRALRRVTGAGKSTPENPNTGRSGFFGILGVAISERNKSTVCEITIASRWGVMTQ